jgi:hypothetical protein
MTLSAGRRSVLPTSARHLAHFDISNIHSESTNQSPWPRARNNHMRHRQLGDEAESLQSRPGAFLILLPKGLINFVLDCALTRASLAGWGGAKC